MQIIHGIFAFTMTVVTLTYVYELDGFLKQVHFFNKCNVVNNHTLSAAQLLLVLVVIQVELAQIGHFN